MKAGQLDQRVTVERFTSTEDELGQPLLVRQARGLQLTDVGRVVFERGQEEGIDIGA